MMTRLAVFASGGGTNAENIIRHFSGTPEVTVEFVLCNNPGAGVISRCENIGAKCILFKKDGLENGDILKLLKKEKIDYIILAGFLLKIPENIVSAYPNKIINIHPSLLPKFGGKGMYGSHVHEAVIKAEEQVSGITIHYANGQYDRGDIIFQAETRVETGETPESLAAKIHKLEQDNFPVVIENVIKKNGTQKIKVKETPLEAQYNAIKAKYHDAVLLFRMGDFYETFGGDAETVSRILGIVLTKRGNGATSQTALAGFPYHALDNYLPKLVAAGLRIAICEQLEDPKKAKGIVKRGVTELITPGIHQSDTVLKPSANNYLAAVHFGARGNFGLAFFDMSTGEFLVTEGGREMVKKLLEDYRPSEIIFKKEHRSVFRDYFEGPWQLYGLDDWAFSPKNGYEALTKHFGTVSLKAFNLDDKPDSQAASGAVLSYLRQTEHANLGHISSIRSLPANDFMWIDQSTFRNLEIFSSQSEKGLSLLKTIDKTKTAMGGRLLKKWLAYPLLDKRRIEQRQSVVRYFLNESQKSEEISERLSCVSDLERAAAKIATKKISPRELTGFCDAIEAVNVVKKICIYADCPYLVQLADSIESFVDLNDIIRNTIEADAPHSLGKGGIIKRGVSSELDYLNELIHNNKLVLNRIIENEIEKSGINRMKLRHNNITGYVFELGKSFSEKVPEHWIRRATLVNAERYTTPELSKFNEQYAGAVDRMQELETSLYFDFLEKLTSFIPAIQKNAQTVARLDVLMSFAVAAKENGYTCPLMDESTELEITDGRHPVIEKRLKQGQEYIANSVALNRDSQQIIMITGPNMSGKSAVLRQTALIVLLAQAGSYVPAKNARIGIVDKIFTRVGASDSISEGESTFMVEMNEAANILNNVSERSLIVLDELGRGTSTYDGISIAWAISEFLHESKQRPKTLFATHYHELNDMAASFPRIKNYNVSVKEGQGEIIFLRKLVEGGSNHSFGIHVAKMAGMPPKVYRRAEEILSQLESSHSADTSSGGKAKKEDNYQLSFFQLEDPTLVNIREQLENIDIDSLTPLEALVKLNEIKKSIGLK